MALSEEVIYDERGNLKTDNFSKYHIINAPSMPEVKTLFIEKGDPVGPFGAKSIGELAAGAPAPALMNAINHALGTNLTSYPATPEKIIEALNK
jgi:xanthine dehydrogenase molybdenum-binding subunit